MMIIARGEPELCCWRHAKRKGGVYAHLYACVSVQNVVSTCCAYVGNCEKGLCEVTREKNWRTWNPRDAWRHRQGRRGSLVSLSFQPHSLLRGHLCFSLSHHRRSQSCSYHHYALHCSHECGMAAWQRGHVQRISITWMGRTQLVGRSVDARGPIDHDSVGLAQAHPNYLLSTKYEHICKTI